jgi:membrane protein
MAYKPRETISTENYMTFEQLISFFRYDLWRIRLRSLSRKKSFFIKNLRIIVLAARSFGEDKCSLRASALTYYSLFSIVPLAAFVFSIAKGFDMQKRLETLLLENMKGQEEVIPYIVKWANSLLEGAKGGVIAGIGILFLVYLVIMLLSNIEQSFNDIWGVKHARSISRKLSDYLSILSIAPILFILQNSITVFVTTQITKITAKIDILGLVSPLILFVLKLFPYCVIWLLFTFIYMFMPNCKVRLRSGLAGGIIAGTIFGIVQWVYITSQVLVSRYSTIYGSFAIVPLFFLWVWISWIIVLLGAEISFAHQNVDTYEFEPDSLHVSYSFRRLLALRITHLCVRNFIEGNSPLTSEEISNKLEVPIRLTNQTIYDLVQCRVLSETVGESEKSPTYQPARDVGLLSISFVVKALDSLGTTNIPLNHNNATESISRSLEEFTSMMDKSDANLLLKDIR